MDWAYSSSFNAEQHSEMFVHTFNMLGLPYSVFTWACMFLAVFLPIVLKISKAAFQYNCLKKIWPEKQEESEKKTPKKAFTNMWSSENCKNNYWFASHSSVTAHCAEPTIPLPRPTASFTAPGFSAGTQNGRWICCLMSARALSS